MEELHIWNIVLTAGLSAGGFVLKHLFHKTEQIVPEEEIRQLIHDGLAPEAVKQAMIYERLIHIEGKMDRLMEYLRDEGRDKNNSYRAP